MDSDFKVKDELVWQCCYERVLNPRFEFHHHPRYMMTTQKPIETINHLIYDHVFRGDMLRDPKTVDYVLCSAFIKIRTLAVNKRVLTLAHSELSLSMRDFFKDITGNSKSDKYGSWIEALMGAISATAGMKNRMQALVPQQGMTAADMLNAMSMLETFVLESWCTRINTEVGRKVAVGMLTKFTSEHKIAMCQWLRTILRVHQERHPQTSLTIDWAVARHMVMVIIRPDVGADFIFTTMRLERVRILALHTMFTDTLDRFILHKASQKFVGASTEQLQRFCRLPASPMRVQATATLMKAMTDIIICPTEDAPENHYDIDHKRAMFELFARTKDMGQAHLRVFGPLYRELAYSD